MLLEIGNFHSITLPSSNAISSTLSVSSKISWRRYWKKALYRTRTERGRQAKTKPAVLIDGTTAVVAWIEPSGWRVHVTRSHFSFHGINLCEERCRTRDSLSFQRRSGYIRSARAPTRGIHAPHVITALHSLCSRGREGGVERALILSSVAPHHRYND